MLRNETPHPLVAPLVTGRFREEPAYATWRARGTEDYLLILTVSGRGRFGRAGAPGDRSDLLAGPGDAVLLKPGTRHDYGTARGVEGGHWELLWVHFLPRPHWLEWLAWPEAAPGLLHLSLGKEAAARVEDALTAMHRHATGGLPRRDAFALNALETALLWCDAVNPLTASARAPRLDPRVQRAMTLLRERLGEPVSVPELARAVGLSASRLAHLFREQTGQTPQQFVERERVTRAQQLLAFTSRSVGAIAEEVGYASPFYFAQRFRQQTGLSPRAWRQEEARKRNDPPPAEATS